MRKSFSEEKDFGLPPNTDDDATEIVHTSTSTSTPPTQLNIQKGVRVDERSKEVVVVAI